MYKKNEAKMEEDLKRFQNVSVVNFRKIQKEADNIIEKANRELHEGISKLKKIASSSGVRVNRFINEPNYKKPTNKLLRLSKK